MTPPHTPPDTSRRGRRRVRNQRSAESLRLQQALHPGRGIDIIEPLLHLEVADTERRCPAVLPRKQIGQAVPECPLQMAPALLREKWRRRPSETAASQLRRGRR